MGEDFLSGEKAVTVHHIVSRRWKSVELLYDNGLAVSARTHARIHTCDRECLETIVDVTIGFARYERIVRACEKERGFKDTMYYEVYLCRKQRR